MVATAEGSRYEGRFPSVSDTRCNDLRPGDSFFARCSTRCKAAGEHFQRRAMPLPAHLLQLAAGRRLFALLPRALGVWASAAAALLIAVASVVVVVGLSRRAQP